MSKIVLFGEDYAHEIVVGKLIERLAREMGRDVTLAIRSAQGGHGRMIRELKAFVGELADFRAPLPDLLVIVRDANCRGLSACKKEITDALGGYSGDFLAAIPDPHIERWLLLDSHAFKSVLGAGCKLPKSKCDRDRYKVLLDAAIRAAGVEPLLGGIEFAQDIIEALDLDRASAADRSFGRAVTDLRSLMKGLSTGSSG